MGPRTSELWRSFTYDQQLVLKYRAELLHADTIAAMTGASTRTIGKRYRKALAKMNPVQRRRWLEHLGQKRVWMRSKDARFRRHMSRLARDLQKSPELSK